MLGTQKRYKKLKKKAVTGQKDQFLQTERFLFKLLQEIGGAEFYAAEDLYEKLKKQKRRSKGQKNDEPEETKTEEEDSKANTIRDKIFEKLDSKLGKWEDNESDDSESDDEELFPTLEINGGKSEECESNSKSADELQSSATISKPSKRSSKAKEIANDGKPNASKQTSSVKSKSPIVLKSKKSSPVDNLDNNAVTKSKKKSPKIKALSTPDTSVSSQPSEDKKEVVSLPKESADPPPPAKSLGSVSKVATIDLKKAAKAGEILNFNHSKRRREIDPETEELEELPKKIAKLRHKRKGPAEGASDGSGRPKKKTGFFSSEVGEEDDEDSEDDSEEQLKFNARHHNNFESEGQVLQHAFYGRGRGGPARGGASRGGRGALQVVGEGVEEGALQVVGEGVEEGALQVVEEADLEEEVLQEVEEGTTFPMDWIGNPLLVAEETKEKETLLILKMLGANHVSISRDTKMLHHKMEVASEINAFIY